jgi:hypothetical protein
MNKNELNCDKCHRVTICSERWYGATCVCGAWIRNYDAALLGVLANDPAPTISIVQTTTKLQEKIRQFNNALNAQETILQVIDLSKRNLQDLTSAVARRVLQDRIRSSEAELVENSKKLIDLKDDLDALLREQHPSCFEAGDRMGYVAVVPARKRDASPKRAKK